MSLKFNKKEILLIPQIFVTGSLFYTFTGIHSYISKLVIGISNSFCERGYLFQAVTLFSLIYLWLAVINLTLCLFDSGKDYR